MQPSIKRTLVGPLGATVLIGAVSGLSACGHHSALMGTTTNPRAEVATLVAGEKFDRTRAQALLREKTSALTTKSPEVIAATDNGA